jgi:hypothetical protein
MMEAAPETGLFAPYEAAEILLGTGMPTAIRIVNESGQF